MSSNAVAIYQELNSRMLKGPRCSSCGVRRRLTSPWAPDQSPRPCSDPIRGDRWEAPIVLEPGRCDACWLAVMVESLSQPMAPEMVAARAKLAKLEAKEREVVLCLEADPLPNPKGLRRLKAKRKRRTRATTARPKSKKGVVPSGIAGLMDQILGGL